MSTPNQHYAILLDAALFEIEQGNLNAAKCHLELARYGNPRANGPLIALALAILKIDKDHAAADALLAEACRMDLNDPVPRLILGELEAAKENYQNAAIGADKILSGLPNDYAAILAMLQYRDCSGETAKAAEELAAFVRRISVHGGIVKAAADLLHHCKRDDDAKALEALA